MLEDNACNKKYLAQTRKQINIKNTQDNTIARNTTN